MANCVNSTTFYTYHTDLGLLNLLESPTSPYEFSLWHRKIDNKCMYALFFLYLELTYRMALPVPNKIQAK